MSDMPAYIARIVEGENLDQSSAYAAFQLMIHGKATEAQIGGFLMALRTRGETIDEIVGAANALRDEAATIKAPDDVIDTCGTGGDGKGSFNISTAAAIVAAACGAKIAKHGNKAQTSKSGSADVLAALGLRLDAPLSACSRALETAGICFLMAPRHHQAMRHVAPARQQLGTRSLFNLVGPLANPARARRQLVGVFAPEWVLPIAHALKHLGGLRAWVVHGEDGLDEITLAAPTQIAELKDGQIHQFTLKPQDVGLTPAPTHALKGGDSEENATLMRGVFSGKPGPLRDVTLINAAAALVVADRAGDLTDGVKQAAQAIDSGRASTTLDQLIAAYGDPLAS